MEIDIDTYSYIYSLMIIKTHYMMIKAIVSSNLLVRQPDGKHVNYNLMIF